MGPVTAVTPRFVSFAAYLIYESRGYIKKDSSMRPP